MLRQLGQRINQRVYRTITADELVGICDRPANIRADQPRQLTGGGLATTIGWGERAWGPQASRRFYGPSVLRRRHSGRLSHRSWLALPVLVMVRGCAWGRGQAAAVWRSTGAIMGNVVYDFLLFSCMALFVTGIVLAAASLLI